MMAIENIKRKIIEDLNKEFSIHQGKYLNPIDSNKIIIDFLIEKIVDLQYQINELKD